MQKFLRKIVSGVLWLGVFLCFGMASLYAENSPLIITEIHPEEEFIELQNISDENILLTGYTYSEETGSGTEKKYPFPEQNNEVLPGDFFVIELSRKINNSGDVVRVYDAGGQKLAEQEIPSSVSGKSYALIDGAWSWETPTKGGENTQAESAEEQEQENEEESEMENNENVGNANLHSLQGSIIISEIFPNPEGSDSAFEFIELHNTGEGDVSIDDLYVEDASGKKFFLSQLPESQRILSGGGYVSLPYSQTKISVNNSDEAIFLKNSAGEAVSSVEFSGDAPEGSTFAVFSGVYQWTETPTEGTENVLTVSQDAASSSSSAGTTSTEDGIELFDMNDGGRMQYAPTGNDTDAKKIVLHIQKIFPSSRPDRVDILCVHCDMSLEGIRLGVDGEVFRVPDIFGETGEVLSFEFENISAAEKKKRELFAAQNPLLLPSSFVKTDKGWTFFVPVSGLTSTDETVYVGDKNGKILDAVFYSNKNGYFPSAEKEVLQEIINREEWTGVAQEFSGVSTVAMSKDAFLKRRSQPGVDNADAVSLQDTDAARDFYRGFLTDDVHFSFLLSASAPFSRKKNTSVFDHQIEKLKFSRIVFMPEKIEIFVENRSLHPIRLSDYFLTNREKFLVRLDENHKVLFPGQELRLVFGGSAFKKIKKTRSWKNSDIFFDIRDRNSDIFDVLCFESVQKSSKFRSSRYHQHFLSSPEQKNCFSVPEKNNDISHEGFQLIRENFLFPVSPDSYSTQEFVFPAEETENTQNIESIEDTEDSEYREYLGKKIGRFPSPLLPDNEIFERPSTPELGRVVLSRVLPNPKGKDSGAEEVFIKNVSDEPVWVRNFSLKTTGRKNGKKLPMIYLLPDQEKKVLFFTGFVMKNSQEELSLLSGKNEVIDMVSWEKARDNEVFGAFAPAYIPPPKKKKSQKSKNNTNKKNTTKQKGENDKNSISRKNMPKGQDLPALAFQEQSTEHIISFSALLWGVFVFSGVSLLMGMFLWRRYLRKSGFLNLFSV